MAHLKLAGALALLIVLSGQTSHAQAGFSCTEDARIDMTKRNAIEAVANQFIQATIGANPSAALDLMPKAAQASDRRQQFLDGAATIRQFQPKNVQLQHTYLIELNGPSPGRVICTTGPSKPDSWQSLAASSVPEQAHVLLTADGVNNKLAFTLWLAPENEGWKIQSFSMTPSTLAEKDSVQLWELARAQRAKQHTFNAALLYASAVQTADRGPVFQLSIAQTISADFADFIGPPEVTGKLPLFWVDQKTSYKIIGIGPTAIGGKIYVNIIHEVSPWQSDAQVDGWNKELLSYFKRRFPEFSEVFSGVIVRAFEVGGKRGYDNSEEIPSSK